MNILFWYTTDPIQWISLSQCRWKTCMVHQTFVWWALYIPYEFVKSSIRYFGLAIGNVRSVRRFLPTLLSVLWLLMAWCFSASASVATFLAATKQLYKWYFPSVRLSVRLSHLFDSVPIIVSSWNFQELLPMTKVRSMQKVKVRGERSRSQRSQPNLSVSGL